MCGDEDEHDDDKSCSLWLQWSPSNPGWHWHLPRTQAPCPWHPFTQPSVNSCKMPLLEVCGDLLCMFVSVAGFVYLLVFFYGHLRVLRHQNNIVFIAVVVVNGDKPVALLHEEVWQASNQLLKKRGFWQRFEKHWLGSKFLHLKLAKSVKLGLGAWCAASWNLFKVRTTLRLNFSFNCCNILFEIPQNVPPCWWWFTIYWITPSRPSEHPSSAWRLEIWYKPW